MRDVMKFTLDNIGALEHADIELGNLTIICGENNMGKTYATYAIYGFLNMVKKNKFALFDEKIIDEVIEKHSATILLDEYIDSQALETIEFACERYFEDELVNVFSPYDDSLFSKSKFKASIELNKKYIEEMGFDLGAFFGDEGQSIKIYKEKDSYRLNIIFIPSEKGDVDYNFAYFVIESELIRFLGEKVVYADFPEAFIVSAERTGISTFATDFDSSNADFRYKIRNKAKEINGQSKNNSDTDKIEQLEKLLKEAEINHTLPVRENIEFNRRLFKIKNRQSFIAEKHEDILKIFDEMAGGTYDVQENMPPLFTPKNSETELGMSESASSVRSLLMLNYYLRHEAKQGHLLMIDEPELNLHPKNQRKMAQLIARLVNAGIKVFITTHSDYIIRELNSLILLGQKKEIFEKKKGGKPNKSSSKESDDWIKNYNINEFLNYKNIKVYNAKADDIKLSKNKKTALGYMLVEIPVDKRGIRIESFDDNIDAMNNIQTSLVYGSKWNE